jgi:hypothetical protein
MPTPLPQVLLEGNARLANAAIKRRRPNVPGRGGRQHEDASHHRHRSYDKVRGEWQIVGAAHNLKRMHTLTFKAVKAG